MRNERRALLRNADFTRYILARFLGSLAVQMQTVAVGWQVYEITRRPLDLGLIGLSQFLPFVLLILPAGHYADTRDRRRIIAGCYVLLLLCALLLLAFSWHRLRSAWPVFGIMTLFGVARAFAMPASQALLPNLVDREHFGTAIAFNSSLWQVSTIAGPALGGLLYLAGATAVYATVATLLAVSLVMLAMLRRGGDASAAASTAPLDRHALLEGLRFVRGRRPVLGAISLDLFAVLFGGATALLPVYAADVLHVGPSGLGWLRAAPGVGAALTGVVLGVLPVTRRVGHWMFGGVIVFGFATLVFGVSTSLWISLAALTVLGAGDMVSVYIRHLLVQLQTPDDIRGRVSAVNAVFIGASNELGEFESGFVAAWVGAIPAVVIGGGATLFVALAWTRLFPELWRMDRFPDQEE
ncbi:MAG: MFS transporter [Steroidobacteraceae bacterium]|nr:MFS transporter [Steroidobacteraceae bacterium]MBP7013629.1 MFS transporter [Steroidobacteraceae bacterium]